MLGPLSISMSVPYFHLFRGVIFASLGKERTEREREGGAYSRGRGEGGGHPGLPGERPVTHPVGAVATDHKGHPSRWKLV